MIKILDAEQVPLSELLSSTEDQRDISGIVTGIIDNVRRYGDTALLSYSREFDKVEPVALEVPREQLDR